MPEYTTLTVLREYAKLKMRGPGASCVHAPDIFIPAIIESYGLVHNDLRKVLHSLAESHISQSVSDDGFSDDGAVDRYLNKMVLLGYN